MKKKHHKDKSQNVETMIKMKRDFFLTIFYTI